MSTALFLTMSLGLVPAAAQTALDAPVVSMADWTYDDLYQGGAMSAEEFIDEMEVLGVAGDEIGDIEDIIIGADGKVLAVIAEVGGFWDIGDTHISVPWSEIEISGENVVLPVTEDTVDQYGLFDQEYLTASQVAGEVTGGVDNAAVGPRAWRVSELIGDYARLRGETDETFVNYGYVNDVLIRDGEVAAVVVTPDVGYGVGGYRAYPYYGPGWAPGRGYYDLPYRTGEMGDLEAFEYDRIEPLG